MKRALLTGGSGQLGIELQRAKWPTDWILEAPGVADLDLRDTAAIAAKVFEKPWAAVINAGAFTAVDGAQRDVVSAWAINALAPAAFAQACAGTAIPLVQISTDYVFDGNKTGRWNEDDKTAPLNVYGASKLGGELAVRTAHSRHAIIRTSWLVSAHGNNFVKTMLKLGSDRNEIGVVCDQYGAPTSAADLAAAIVRIVVRLEQDPQAPVGTFHFSNAGETTWHGFAEAIFAGAARRGSASTRARPITTAEFRTPAPRPINSLLSHRAIGTRFGIEPRSWQEALDDILDELLETG